MTDTHEVTVMSVYQMTPNVKQFVLESDDYTFDFSPGQHTHIHFEQDGEEVVRPYTSTALPGHEKITLAIKRYPDGTASTWMHDRDPGDTVEIEELGGNLHIRNLDSDVAFVSTGTGITPMMAMAKQYVNEGSGHAHFFFGEKDEEHIIYRETLDQMATENDDFDVTYVLSEQSWAGDEGHVQEHLSDYLDDFGSRDFYVCGVPQMVVETEDVLKDEGAGEDRIFSEGWEGDEVSGEE
ncbi:ferredoxin--NADP reductase [Halorussus halophilus]|uniref:ferredoxin--NADP reductase n=1 Tax=Halorussus halophilus TaxID=2650975 RepID=UPI001301667A|nr:FAD-dependent oxidoreductase [Halorussus halophilus]